MRSELDELTDLAAKARTGNPRALAYFAWRARDVAKGIRVDVRMFRAELEDAVAAERERTA